jgi:hypothetical protein
MTRINTIPPRELCDQHLLAEIREITRVPNTIKSGRAIVDINKLPKIFTLGKGHVTFFYDKVKYLKDRYKQLLYECLKRGFNPQNNTNSFDDIPIHLMNDWTPTEHSIELIKNRIAERKQSMKHIKYYGKEIKGIVYIKDLL